MLGGRNITLINPEWFREPLSPLESTLRLPHLIKHAIVLFLTRPGFKWVVLGLMFWLISRNFIASTLLGFITALASELFTLNNYYKNIAVPRHIQNIKQVKAKLKISNDLSPKQLAEAISNSVDKSGWGLINIGYVGLAAWGWELIFKLLYPLLTKSTIKYQTLLVGFLNKTTESDQALWEIAHQENKKLKTKLFNKYLENFGSKVDDMELSKPTLRENSEVVAKLLELYKTTPSPQSTVEKQKEKREHVKKQVMQNLKIPKSLFLSLLKIVQENVVLRENRRHYHFIVDYEIRMMLLKLARILKLSEKELFNKSWNQIRALVN